MWQEFTEPTRAALIRAQNIALERNNALVESGHICMALVEENEGNFPVLQLLLSNGIAFQEVRLYAESTLPQVFEPAEQPVLSPEAKRILELAAEEARFAGSDYIEVTDLFIACVQRQRGSHLGEVLRPLGLDVKKLRAHVTRVGRAPQPYPRGHPLNLFDEEGRKIIDAAHEAMRASYCGQISTVHLLLGLLEEPGASDVVWEHVGISPSDLKAKLQSSIKQDGLVATPQKKFTPAAKRALDRAAKGKPDFPGAIRPYDLLSALLPQTSTLKEKIAYGFSITDPLEPIWGSLPVERIRETARGERISELLQEKADLERPPKNLPPSPECQRVLDIAKREALGRPVSLSHLLLGMLSVTNSSALESLQKAGCNVEKLAAKARKLGASGAKSSASSRELTLAAEHAMKVVSDISRITKSESLKSDELLLAMVHTWFRKVREPEAAAERQRIGDLFTHQQINSIHRQVIPSRVDSLELYGPVGMWEYLGRNKIPLFSFCFGFVCSAMMVQSPAFSAGTIGAIILMLAVLLVSSFGCLITIFTNRSNRIKTFWMNIFGGYLGGLMLGFWIASS